MKLYMGVEGSVRLRRDEQELHISVSSSRVTLGVRSFHENPAGIVYIGDDPEDLMSGVSLLGSALKTLSPERSFPTLRGHPPLIQFGDSFSAPPEIKRPDVDIQIVVPPTRTNIFSVASLAYYLGAEVVPGSSPRIIAGGVEYPISEGQFEQEVNRLLRQLVFLDCITRTEGYYQIDLYERQELEKHLTLPWCDLYDRPLEERTQTYLDVEYETVKPYIPTWGLTADLSPQLTNAQALPFLANDLALIRVSESECEWIPPTPDNVSDLLRGSCDRTTRTTDSENIFTPTEAETLEHVYLGNGYPLDSSKATIESYYRRLDRSTPSTTDIQVHVVCNDDEMSDEEVVESFYGVRDMFDFDVELHYGLTTCQMRELLSEPSDFVHFVGHITENGIQCPDGYLDTHSLAEVNTKAFLLNACRSYEQGMELVRKGSLGGIVTLAEVSNTPAVRVGRALARLLNHGFPLRAALAVAKKKSLTGYQYIVVGDGSLQLVQTETGSAMTVEVERLEGDVCDVSFRTFPTPGYGVGAIMSPNIDTDGLRFLHPGSTKTFEIAIAELHQLLSQENLPVEMDGHVYWSDEFIQKTRE
ncbi:MULTISPECIES: hypothetical protein [unclassified Haloferax]|uniref:hypothetical protein n=1 Tax=unclassified Haloferax TaxID=2625095 RepID=UPI00287589F2|nr:MULTISPECIES: hypothetical protein [unclassified Haloferax]MDS0243177.1 hypothetical protein [Haloferax sp. S2CR25]MDS0446298.1 hypothetical protein [Haloferax sp. S2CR25-2]